MKRIIIATCFYCCIWTFSFAQIQTPVHWSQGMKKVAANQYEVHILAAIDDGWHIYAQKQLPGAVALPTKIVLNKEPRIRSTGKIVEIGKKETYTIKEAGVTNYEYASKVDFVQRITLLSGVKEVRGTVTWQACTHKQCLPPETLNFTIAVN